MDAPNFSPIADADWPDQIHDLRAGFAGSLNVYRVMAHHPGLLRAWTTLREHVVRQSSLGAVRSEVVILRTGHNMGSHYEWVHHTLRGREHGMSDARIQSMAGPLSAMQAEDAVFAQAVDQLCQTGAMDTDTQAKLAALVGKHGVLDVIATVGFYTTLGFILNSFAVPLEPATEAAFDDAQAKSGSTSALCG